VGDEEPITEQAITRHHNDSLGGKAQIDPFGRPDTSWESESESWLNTTQVERHKSRGCGRVTYHQKTRDPQLACIGLFK
jgi:hypothetical protein